MSAKLNPQPEPPGISFILGILQAVFDFVLRALGIIFGQTLA